MGITPTPIGTREIWGTRCTVNSGTRQKSKNLSGEDGREQWRQPLNFHEIITFSSWIPVDTREYLGHGAGTMVVITTGSGSDFSKFKGWRYAADL